MRKNTQKRQRLKYSILTKVILEKIHLFEKLYRDRITPSETARLSFLVGMMTGDDYAAYLKFEKEYGSLRGKS